MGANDAINQRIFETSLDLILVVTRKGDFVRVSPSSEQIIGYHPDEMVGKSAIEFIYPDDLESTRNEMRRALKDGQNRNFDCRYIHRIGTIVPLSWTGVWSNPEQQFFFIGRDMTERNAIELILRQSQKMDAVGQLTGGIAHDFNNILAVIIGNLELVKHGQIDRDVAQKCIITALRSARHGADLTKRLLAFSRTQELQLRTATVNELIKDMEILLQRTLGETIDVSTDLAETVWPTKLDPAMFESAILNLAINARDAMPDGGRLTIQTCNVEVAKDYAEINDLVPGAYVNVIVSDTGTGMTPEVLSHLFEPFFTTKDVGKGTGLGLAMVYGFIKQLKGIIKVYSELGHGTTINIYLPKAETRNSERTSDDEKSAIKSAESIEVILVAEDDPDVRDTVVMMLEGLGYDIIEASDGPSALSLLENGCPCGLLFTDMVMHGGMSGPELAQRAVALRPDLKVLFTSGYPRSARPELGKEAMLLRKPYTLSELSTAIRDALNQ